MQSPSLIINDRLRKEVEQCLSEDMDYSPHLDRVRRGLGAEYEFILQQKLRGRYNHKEWWIMSSLCSLRVRLLLVALKGSCCFLFRVGSYGSNIAEAS